MNDPMKQLMELAAPASERFPPSSRYHGVPTTTLEAADGTVRVSLRRRFVPEPDRLSAIDAHRVVGGDRLDNVTARHLGDPELYWRLCDGNGAVRPDELTETVGRVLRITLPEGVPGSNA